MIFCRISIDFRAESVQIKDLSDRSTDRADSSSGVAGEPLSAEAETSPVSREELEYQLIESLEDDIIQDRIKVMLQKTVREELSKISVVLREAIRNWVFKEKQKYNLTPANQEQQDMARLQQVEEQRKRLEEENLNLKRALELKEHENKIMLSAIKKLTPKPD